MRRFLLRSHPPQHPAHLLPHPHQGSLDVFFLGSLQVLLLSTPSLQGRGLQGSAVREGQRPRLQQVTLVDGAEVDGRLLFTLASR